MTVTRPNAVGVPGYRETLPCEPASVSRARLLVKAALCTWGLADLVEDGMLVASELVTNSVLHSGCRHVRVRVERVSSERVRISVSDKRPSMRGVGKPDAGDEHGRGLVIVGSIAAGLAVERRRRGKVVRAELTTVRAEPGLAVPTQVEPLPSGRR
ncbi:ATP-binding protein [Streptomyces acidiscabies]|uniref:ATP-binding protein n=1 Tax=Streptomyces acidiscabies TaxID=42234 RepID=UPI00067C9D06|nr:ATP-binding protein [Streptomyces acidiscabies]